MDKAQTTEAIRETLEELRDEEDLSKTQRAVVDEMIKTLDEPIDIELRADKIKDLTDALDEDQGLPNHVRMRLWNLSAMLEML